MDPRAVGLLKSVAARPQTSADVHRVITFKESAAHQLSYAGAAPSVFADSSTHDAASTDIHRRCCQTVVKPHPVAAGVNFPPDKGCTQNTRLYPEIDGLRPRLLVGQQALTFWPATTREIAADEVRRVAG